MWKGTLVSSVSYIYIHSTWSSRELPESQFQSENRVLSLLFKYCFSKNPHFFFLLSKLQKNSSTSNYQLQSMNTTK
jgi:hypothetical protein